MNDDGGTGTSAPVARRSAWDGLTLIGSGLALAGYLLPWFRVSASYDWWFSGWQYATLSTGGGWTLVTVGWLTLAVAAGLGAGRWSGAATTALVGAVGGLMFACAVVAASFATMPRRDSLNWVGELQIGPGLPVMVVGFGLLYAGAVRALVRQTVAPR